MSNHVYLEFQNKTTECGTEIMLDNLPGKTHGTSDTRSKKSSKPNKGHERTSKGYASRRKKIIPNGKSEGHARMIKNLV